MTEWRMFQQLCRRLQQSAQTLGEANDGEGGLNCFDDYKEKQRIEDVEKALQNLAQTAQPGGAEFLNTLKMAPKDHATRNLLIVMGLVRDMGPDKSDAFWLPRPPSPHPPVLPEPPVPPKPGEEEKPDASEQSMAFDVQAAAALNGWLASRTSVRWPHRRPREAGRMNEFLNP